MYFEQVFCSCKTNCSSARCGCKKSGLKCNQFCRNCQGQSCDNASTTSFLLEEDENKDKEEEEHDDDDSDDDDDDGEEENTTESREHENNDIRIVNTGRLATKRNTRSKVISPKV